MTTTEQGRSAAAKVALAQTVAEAGAEFFADFVPMSKSRNAGEKTLTINWRVGFRFVDKWQRGSVVFDYQQEIGHLPAVYRDTKKVGSPNSLHRVGLERQAVENGKVPGWPSVVTPTLADVMWSLAMDADVRDYPTFEEWAAETGYDEDSRKAERIYKAAMEQTQRLGCFFGWTTWDRLCKLATITDDAAAFPEVEL